MNKQLSREELIILVNDIMNVEGRTEEEIVKLVELLKKNVPHPSVSDLIYWEDLTADEIVDKALSYRSIKL